jgi:hypothetical protein
MALFRPITALVRPLQPIALRRCVANVSHPPAAALPLAGNGLGSWLRGAVSDLLQRSGVASAAEAAQASVFDGQSMCWAALVLLDVLVCLVLLQ